jgi:NADH:ubiquinone oxidoreductase subunit K
MSFAPRIRAVALIALVIFVWLAWQRDTHLGILFVIALTAASAIVALALLARAIWRRYAR